jgi:hypothetical protein
MNKIAGFDAIVRVTVEYQHGREITMLDNRGGDGDFQVEYRLRDRDGDFNKVAIGENPMYFPEEDIRDYIQEVAVAFTDKPRWK